MVLSMLENYSIFYPTVLSVSTSYRTTLIMLHSTKLSLAMKSVNSVMVVIILPVLAPSASVAVISERFIISSSMSSVKGSNFLAASSANFTRFSK